MKGIAPTMRSVRLWWAVGLLCALLAGCGTGDGGRDRPASAREGAGARAARVDACIERLLSGSPVGSSSEQEARRYAKETYCAPFERNGWVYEDGALSIAAQRWLEQGGECASASEGEPSRTIPCAQADVIDCAVLRHVRQAEALAYIAELKREGELRCDDGTPLQELGVP